MGRASKSESWTEFDGSKVGADAAVSGEIRSQRTGGGEESERAKERNEKTRWREAECVRFEVLKLTDSPQQK